LDITFRCTIYPSCNISLILKRLFYHTQLKLRFGLSFLKNRQQLNKVLIHNSADNKLNSIQERVNLHKNSNSLPDTSTNRNIGNPFIELNEIESTNNYAMQLVQQGIATHGMAVFAHHQTAGKGQRSKQWFSAAGQNIVLSVILRTNNLAVSAQFGLSMAIALAVHEFFTTYAICETFIKWPNDLYWRDRKAGGILIENIIRGKEWQWAIVGIGININQTNFENNIANPVSLKQITGKNFHPVNLSKELCTYIEKAFSQLEKAGIAPIVQAYNGYLYKKGETVTLKKNNILFSGTIQSVDANGFLSVTAATNEDYAVGELEWVNLSL
jgi:BirA family transcriptional regulator, biotin operon repressor / biotin---[acetyl-CoA-carboxylase] ligase